MVRWICQYDAPSIAAASESSSGMPCSPARNRMTAKPMYFQVMITISVQIATFGSDSQSCWQRAEADLLEQPVQRAAWTGA